MLDRVFPIFDMVVFISDYGPRLLMLYRALPVTLTLDPESRESMFFASENLMEPPRCTGVCEA